MSVVINFLNKKTTQVSHAKKTPTTNKQIKRKKQPIKKSICKVYLYIETNILN